MAGLELSDKEKARERLKMNIARRIERYRRRKWWGRVAGIVLLLCMGEGVWFYWQNEVKQTDQDLAERVTASSLPVHSAGLQVRDYVEPGFCLQLGGRLLVS